MYIDDFKVLRSILCTYIHTYVGAFCVPTYASTDLADCLKFRDSSKNKITENFPTSFRKLLTFFRCKSYARFFFLLIFSSTVWQQIQSAFCCRRDVHRNTIECRNCLHVLIIRLNVRIQCRAQEIRLQKIYFRADKTRQWFEAFPQIYFFRRLWRKIGRKCCQLLKC
jgi:hypothetical protein